MRKVMIPPPWYGAGYRSAQDGNGQGAIYSYQTKVGSHKRKAQHFKLKAPFRIQKPRV